MAIGTKGNGSFFATGDPWVYNEHLAAQDNVKGITEVMKWILGLATSVAQPARVPSGTQTSLQHITNGKKYLVNGRMYGNSAGTAASQPNSQMIAHGVVTIEGASSLAKERIPFQQ
jgi:hypothetical protein